MQGFRKEDWRYAFLLVALFGIAARATQVAINYIIPLVGEHDRVVITIMLCSITFGLMLISGAFTIWAIKFEAKTIGMQRLGNLVSSMSYIRDGIIAINRKGLTSGMNPAALVMFNAAENHKYTLQELCPNLSDDNMKLLLKSSEPEEVECEFKGSETIHTLRFRSQPSKDMTIILINDVTHLADRRSRHRRAAYLQLVGHIAQGIANDFNNILCGISGYASLIQLPNSTEKIISDSAQAISDNANRGIQLASSLLELSTTSQSTQQAATIPVSHVENAADAIASDLHASWNITRLIDSDIPPVNLTGSQLEHIIHGLGMLATDIYSKDHSFYIRLTQPSDVGIYQTENSNCAGIIVITPTDINAIDSAGLTLRDSGSVGTIESVVSSILQQSGGQLDCFSTSTGIPVYRLCLPGASKSQLHADQDSLPPGLDAYIAKWSLLICKGKYSSNRELRTYLQNSEVTTIYTDNIIDTLARIEHGADLDGIIIPDTSLGEEREGLLRAITKLCPQAGLVVINKHSEPIKSLLADIVFIPHTHSPAQVIQAAIEAKTLAKRRAQTLS